MSEAFIVKKIGRKPRLKKPILIEGLPGVGNVARIVVDVLIDKLKAKKFLEVYSYYFPNSVFLTGEHKLEMPKLEFYYAKRKKGSDLLFVVSDVQPGDEYASYAFSDKILEIAKSLGVKEIITLGGITSKVNVAKPNVYGAFTDKKYVNKLKKIGVRFDRKGSIILIGAAGLLLGLGELKGMKGFSLLAESFVGSKIGINAARQIILVLAKYLGIKISEKELSFEVNLPQIPRIVRKRTTKKATKPQFNPTYIG
ncbi:MAG: PAC2 family protein [Nanoarchaeota archaeon]|nr:PAC2 family protein [Nanoarchaeota archaeon]